MPSIKLRCGNWRVLIRRKGHYASDTFTTKHAAEVWARKTEREIDEGVYAKPDRSMTARKVFKDFMDNPPKDRRGLKWDQTRLKKLMKAGWTAKPLHEVTAADIETWIAGQKISGPSIRREINLMSGVFRRAKALNPMRGVSKPKDSKARNRRPSIAELGALRSHLNKKMLLLMELAIETGMRLGELCDTLWPNIHEHYIHIPKTKNGDPRDVPLSSAAKALLTPRGAGRLFTFGAGSAGVYWRRATKELGIKNLHFHDLRHEAATRMASKLSVLELAAVLGHRDLKSLQRYYNPTPVELSAKLG